MQFKDPFTSRKNEVKSNDLKKRLFEIGVNTASHTQLKGLVLDQIPVSALSCLKNKKENSPHLLKASIPGVLKMNKTASKEFQIRKQHKQMSSSQNQSQVICEEGSNLKQSKLESNSPKMKTQQSFFKREFSSQKNRNENHQSRLNFEKNESLVKSNEKLMTTTLMEKLSGKLTPEKLKKSESYNSNENELMKDEIIEDSGLNNRLPAMKEESNLEEYIRLVMRDAQNIDEFLYLVKKNSLRKESEEQGEENDNIYQLEIVSFQEIKDREKQTHFEYYTVSKKGFCHYFNGKPHAFIEIEEWTQEKDIYQKIKKLKFFNRFRKWKTIKMWKKTVVKHRIEICANNLEEKLFYLQPIMRNCLLEIRAINMEMDQSILIISKNQGNYSLESFKHCQEKIRRETSIVIQDFSRKSRTFVKKCFDANLDHLKDALKAKNSNDEKGFNSSSIASQSPKDNAFQALGFPSKMSYEHRSKLRKMTGKFIRFSYLIDTIYLTGLANIFNNQIGIFIKKLEEIQLNEQVRLKNTMEDGKNVDDIEREKMFNIQLACNFKEISERNVSKLPLKSFDASENKANFIPAYHIKLKSEVQPLELHRRYVSKICEEWLSMRPNLDEIFDELNYLIKEALNSLKYFERWSKHREMQKYVNILEEWDDIVSDNWEISENDNLDPFTIIVDTFDSSLAKIKDIIFSSEKKINQAIKNKMTSLLNVYWENQQMQLLKLQSDQLENPAEAMELFLIYMTSKIETFSIEIPHRVELGIFSVHLTKIKNSIIQNFANILESLKNKLPGLVEERTNELSEWFGDYGVKLKEEILNIDDYVKINKILREVEEKIYEKKELCNDLGQLYQTMQNFKIDTRKRKDFESYTLKLKDQLEQAILNAEQVIERKQDIYTREVLKYHLPNLLKDIEKIRESVESPDYLRLNGNRQTILESLQQMKLKYSELIKRKQQCQEYIVVLKLNKNKIQTLDELNMQIMCRIELWQNLQEWQSFSQTIMKKYINQINFKKSFEEVKHFKLICEKLSTQLPANQVLSKLSKSADLFFTNIPLLEGFNEQLSQGHWNQIYQTIPEKITFDLKKLHYTFQAFLESSIGNYAKEITNIFEKCKVEMSLQKIYHEIEERWNLATVKCKIESKFCIIWNQELIRDEFDQMIAMLSKILSNPFSESLKQYSITYDSIMSAFKSFQSWIQLQQKLITLDKNCRLLDIKKLQDYGYFENAERIYKNMTKLFTNKNLENGVKLAKLLVSGLDEKIAEAQQNLMKVEENIKNFLTDRRNAFPQFYLFSDAKLLRIITENSHENIEEAAKCLLPGLAKIEFEGERITGLITIDHEKIIKNAISLTSDLEQILSQIIDTMLDTTRRTMRNCRYKAIECNVTSLVQNYNIQFLLAISKVDFCHYTEISIDNQQESPQALREFFKVMKKDTTDDLKTRNQISIALLPKYDSLILQSLLHEEVLDRMIRINVFTTTDFNWINELRFTWEENAGNAEDINISVKKMHIKIKYGSEFLGSKAKVMLGSQTELFAAIKYNQKCLYKGTKYSLERMVNSIGYKMLELDCNEMTSIQNLQHFMIGSYYSEYFPSFQEIDALSKPILQALQQQSWISQFKEFTLKKNHNFVKDFETKYAPAFMTAKNYQENEDFFRGKMRIISYNMPSAVVLKNTLKTIGIYDQNISNLILKICETVEILEEKSYYQGICIYEFVDDQLLSNISRDGRTLIRELMIYLKSKMCPSDYRSIQKHVEGVCCYSSENVMATLQNKVDRESILQIIRTSLQERRVLILVGKGSSKKAAIQKLFASTHQIISIYSDIVTNQDLHANQHTLGLIETYLQNPNQQILYFEGLKENIILQIQRMLLNHSLRSKIFQSNTFIVVEAVTLEKIIDPKLITSFPIVTYEFQKEYVQELISQWVSKNLEGDSQKLFSKLFNEMVWPTFENWNIKDICIIDEKIFTFVAILQSILPIKNVIEGVVYALTWMHRNLGEDEVKLQFLIKKYLGQEKIREGVKVHQLVYADFPDRSGLVEESKYLKSQIHEIVFQNSSNVLTEQAFHHCIVATRILQKTSYAIFVSGKSNSGKSILLNTLKNYHHRNTACLKISLLQRCSVNDFNRKLQNVIQKHNLSEMKAKINYAHSLIMIDDVNLAMEDELSLNKLQIAKQILKYKTFDLVNNYQKERNQVDDIRFVFAGQNMPELLSKTAFNIALSMTDEQIKLIYSQFLANCIDSNLNLNNLLLEKIASSTFQLCKKIEQRNTEFKGVNLQLQHSMFSAFKRLKIKDMNNSIKEVERYWAYQLFQNLQMYDSCQILEEETKKLNLLTYKQSGLIYSHLQVRPNEQESYKKVQYVKDIKKLFNIINEKIEKYNDSENKKQYGEVFEFINFDETLKSIIKMSNALLLDHDYILYGRGGSGKNSITKLVAFLHGFHFKESQDDLGKHIITLLGDLTTVSSYLLWKKVHSQEDVANICKFYYSDFQTEILGSKDIQKNARVNLKDKEKLNNSSVFVSTKANFKQNISTTTDSYIPPRPKLSIKEVARLRNTFRIVLNIKEKQFLTSIPVEIRSLFCVDYVNQIPSESILEYNQKLLAIDEVACTKRGPTTLCQIYDYSKEKLQISLKSNDDCVRLFSSFASSLIAEMELEANKFQKTLHLCESLKQIYDEAVIQISDIHQRLKVHSSQILEGDESFKEKKIEMQNKLKIKSTLLSNSERLVQIFNCMIPVFKEKHNKIVSFLEDKQYLEECFAVTASYFIHLSNLSYAERQSILKNWYENIPILRQSKRLDSFLPLFLLYEQEFNAEPVDHLVDFYQNMAIIFHSVKPILVDDSCRRGKNWLQKNCSFVVVSEEDKDFLETIAENLSKPSNILIEITKQDTLNNISSSIINTLLYLSDTTSSVNIKNEEIPINKEAKVYLLLGEGIQVPNSVLNEFTIVKFSESAKMFEKSIEDEYMTAMEPNYYLNKLEWMKKIRNLKLDTENSMNQIIESIHEQIEITQDKDQKAEESPLPVETINKEDLILRISTLTDKTMTKAQNQFTKIKEKLQLILDCQEKLAKCDLNLNYNQSSQFIHSCQATREIMHVMTKFHHYSEPSLPEFLKTMKQALNRKLINNPSTLLLFVIKHWGQQYEQSEYLMFCFLILLQSEGHTLSEISRMLNDDTTWSIAFSEDEVLNVNLGRVKEWMRKRIFAIMKSLRMEQLLPYMNAINTPLSPLVKVGSDKKKCKVMVLNSKQMSVEESKKYLLGCNAKIIQISQEQTFESLIKKASNEELQILICNNPAQLREVVRLIKAYGLSEKVLIYYLNKDSSCIQSSLSIAAQHFTINLDNHQPLFTECLQLIENCTQIPDLQEKSLPLPNHQLNTTKISQQSLELTFLELISQYMKQVCTNAGIRIKYFHPDEFIRCKQLLDSNEHTGCLSTQQKIIFFLNWGCQFYKDADCPLLQENMVKLSQKIVESSQWQGKDESLLKEMALILEQQILNEKANNYNQIDLVSQCETIIFGLTWERQLKTYFNISNLTKIQTITIEIENLINISQEFTHTPKMKRGSKKQIDIKTRRESWRKLGTIQKESPIPEKKSKDQNKAAQVVKPTATTLANLYLKKEIDSFDDILRKISLDLQSIKQVVCNLGQQKELQFELIQKLVSVQHNIIPSYWKMLMIKRDCESTSLSMSIKNIIGIRNQIFTQLAKYSVTNNSEVDFKCLTNPFDFMKSHFKTEFTKENINQYYFITNNLSPEEQENGSYLKVTNLYSSGWKISTDGFMEVTNDNKIQTLTHYFIIKRNLLPNIGLNVIELFEKIHHPTPLLKVYAVSKKNISGIAVNKLYLKHQSN